MFEIPEFRGYKGSIYEGGTKVPSFIHIGRNSAVPSGRYSGLFHAVDILPTLLASIQIQSTMKHQGFSIRIISAKNRKVKGVHMPLWLLVKDPEIVLE